MKRLIALFLSLTMILTGCSKPQAKNPASESTTNTVSAPAEWVEVLPEFDSQ